MSRPYVKEINWGIYNPDKSKFVYNKDDYRDYSFIGITLADEDYDKKRFKKQRDDIRLNCSCPYFETLSNGHIIYHRCSPSLEKSLKDYDRGIYLPPKKVR